MALLTFACCVFAAWKFGKYYQLIERLVYHQYGI
jgi:hypothetical protein